MDLSERIQRAKKLLFSWPFAEFLVVAALSVGLGHVLEDVEALMPLRNAGYQTFFNGFRAPRMPQRVGIVTIDDDLVYPANPYRQRRLAASLRPVIEKLAADKHVVVLDIRLFVDDSDIGTCDALQECKPRPTSAKDLEDLLVFASAAFGGGSACRLVVPALLVQNTDGSVKNSPTEVSEIIRRKDLKNICFGYTSLLPDNRMIPWRVGTKAGGFVDSLAFRAAMALDPSTPALRAQFSNPPTATFWKPELFPTLPASKVIAGAKFDAFGQVIIIGGNWHIETKGVGNQSDALRDTPVGHIPGYLLHANYIASILSEVFLFDTLGFWTKLLFEILALAALGRGIHKLKKWKRLQPYNTAWPILITALALAIAIIGSGVLVRLFVGIYLDVAIPCLTMGVHARYHDYREAKADQARFFALTAPKSNTPDNTHQPPPPASPTPTPTASANKTPAPTPTTTPTPSTPPTNQ